MTVNDYNRKLFEEWAQDYGNVKVLSSGANTDDEKEGAVADIEAAVQHFDIQDHLLIIGG